MDPVIAAIQSTTCVRRFGGEPGGRMPIVQVYLYSGKSKEQKNELVKRISRDFEEVVGVKPESLHILFHDMEKENWGFAGTLASEATKK
jgi:4-oxalocrotonate tautomerase